MHLPDNIFAITLLPGGIITLWVAWRVFKKKNGALRYFGYMMLMISVWAIAYGCELSSARLSQMLFWINIEYIGISFLAPFWIVFVLRFTGKERWLTPLNLFLIFSVPFLTLLLAWTNQWHHLHYAAVSVDSSGPFPLLSIKPAVWYHVHTVYFYLMLASGMYLIIYRFKKADIFIKRQNNIILAGALIPWIVNFLYLLNFRPFGHLDLTPFAFILSSLVIATGLLRFKLFDLVPIARGLVFESLQEGILVLDTQNRAIDLNPEMKKIVFQQAGQAVGKTPEELFPGVEALKDTPGHENYRVEFKLSQNKTERYYSATVTSIFEKKTVYSGKILLFRDITERKKSEDKLQELNRLKDRLFSIISHDLRSPLISLMDILALAGEGEITGEEFKTIIPDLLKNIGYTSGLVENLLQWSKTQLEGAGTKPVNFDIGEMAAAVLKMFEKAAGAKNIFLTNGIKKEVWVYADKDMVGAVLRNLVNNAIKFCTNGGGVQINAKSYREFVEINVDDTGIGISAENICKLFGTGNFTTRGTGNEQGTGLGLMLCRDFVEKNGGKINVESRINKGSRFYFTLPAKVTALSSQL